MTRFARPTLGGRLRIQPQAGEELLDHRPPQLGRDAPKLAAAAVRAVMHVDATDALEKSCSAVRGSRT